MIKSVLLSLEDAAEYIGIAPITLRRAFYAHRIEAVRLGKLIKFRPAALEAFIENSTIPAASPALS